jgi:hypothetical protein
MKSATLADRPAKLAKSAIFWMKRIFFLKKYENDPISSKIMSAGSGRCIKSWPGIYSASPKATSTYSECSNIYFTSVFMKKYVLHKFFFQKFAQKLTKNSYFFSSCKSFGKNIKKIFFQGWNLIIFFCKKLNFGKYLTPYFGLMKKYQVNKKFYNFEKKHFFWKFFLSFHRKKMYFFYTKKTAEISAEKKFFFWKIILWEVLQITHQSHKKI